MPEVDGVFVQMEDEIASMAAVIGASMGGVKAMTATSGPGFSLKQENLGYAAGAEIPCVIVNVMRGGPSTGMPTRPSQADIMQARWGSHGDYPIIVLTPASVGEIYSETIRAFDLAEQCRSPVVLFFCSGFAIRFYPSLSFCRQSCPCAGPCGCGHWCGCVAHAPARSAGGVCRDSSGCR